jgi:hypothetical protein
MTSAPSFTARKPYGGCGMPRVRLLDIIKHELRNRGYEEVEPSRNEGGVWCSPDGTTDHIMPTIIDCFEREAIND